MIYNVEREKYIKQYNDDGKVIGGDFETYIEQVDAAYFLVTENGVLEFYPESQGNDSSSLGNIYINLARHIPFLAFANGEWKAVRAEQ